MTATTTSNGRARKSLAEQIDRFDKMLEGFAENLNAAVADAVRAAVVVAVREAVQAVLSEMLTNPEMLAKLRDALPEATPATLPQATPVPRPRLRERVVQAWSWLSGKVRSVLAACQSGLNRLGAAVAHQCERARKAVQATWLRLRHFQAQLLLALGVGLAGGVVAYLAAPWLAAVLGGLGGFMTAIVVQGAVLLLRLAASYQPRT
jgi:uncharacterized membrane protein YraQ (UPF0718 family)